MTKPTIEECLLQSSKIGLPDVECQKFWNYYDSKGWKVGKTPMQKWRSAMAGWKLRWAECQAHKPGPDNMEKMLRLKELERVEKALASIRASYSEHQSWDAMDKDRFKRLKARRDEIVKLLGMSV